jgi:hypothetical protein
MRGHSFLSMALFAQRERGRIVFLEKLPQAQLARFSMIQRGRKRIYIMRIDI